MKIKNTILLLKMIAIALLMQSCDFLDSDPQGVIVHEKFYKTEEDLNAALNGVYRQLAGNDLYGDYIQGRLGLHADEGYSSAANDLNSVSFNQATTSDEKILGYWKRLYVIINRANILLANVDNVDINIDIKKRNYIKGEALFLRAYSYFMLVNKFKNIPLVLKLAPNSSPEHTQQPQSDPIAVYNKIIEDMDMASTLVRPISDLPGGGRVNQSAVWGVLSRVCLYMAGEPLKKTEMYAKSEFYAKKVIDTQLHELNPSYEQVFINYSQDKYDTKESIYEIEYWGDNTGLYYTAGRVGRNTGIASSPKSPIGACVGMVRATDHMYKLYDNNDLRRDWTVGPFTYIGDTTDKNYFPSSSTWIRYCAKFRREYEASGSKQVIATSINFPILRYADVLLMYAEAHLMNPTADSGLDLFAQECFNMVRRRGFGVDITTPSQYDYTYTSDEEYMFEIRNERARELGFEMMRRDDLVRWGIYVEQMKMVGLSVPASMVWKRYANAYFNSVSARDVLWPIPSFELGVNKKLKQNQGW